jgi:ATP-binding cassette subfamily B protein
LTNAARKLKQLRETGKVESDVQEDAKWQRKTCSNCGRALPQDSHVCPFCVNKIQALKRLFSYLAPYKWIAIGNGLLSVFGIMLSFVPILMVQPLIDRVFHVSPQATADGISVTAQAPGAREFQLLGMLVGAILFSSAMGAVVNILRGRSVAYLGARVIHDIRSQVYEQLQRLSVAYYDKREVGAVMSRVQNDVGMLQNFLLDAAENVILSSLTILGVMLIMLSKSWTLALAVLLPVPFVIVGTNHYWRGLMKLWRRVWHQNSSLGARLADTLNGVRVVRAFAQEDREVERFRTKSGELREATMNVEQKAAIFYPVIGFIMGLGVPITWFFGGRQVLEGTLQLGALLVFTALLQRLYEPVQSLTRLVNFTTRAMTAAERVFEILDTTPEIRQSENALPMARVEGQVQFRDVFFGYDKHRPVLHGVTLDVQPGEMIGLVGHSGAGKSTLINLLMRFYDVDEGAILIDGIDLRDIDRDDLRSQIGVVLQEPYLFHGTVFDNITYGKPGATPGEVMAAAKAAFAHDFIVNFPDGYDTVVGERGTRLSGGERQRISIARAILHDPRILILDEATASVDTQTEQQIQQALQNLIKGRTTFAIAHRLSTLRNANRLVVLDNGKIAEIGTHDELMNRRGVFHKLVTAQRTLNEITAIGG